MELKNKTWDNGNAIFQPTSFQISNIQSGTGAKNVVPGHLDMSFNFRYSPESSAESLISEFEEIMSKLNIKHEIVWTKSGDPYHTKRNLLKDVEKSDIILLGVSRTSKTPTSIYLANKGYKTANIPLVNKSSIPEIIKKNPQKFCIVGLTTEAERLADIRKNRMNSLKENSNQDYTDLEKIRKEVEEAKNTFKKYNWPTIDVTRKSVEETAASIIKIYDIYLSKNIK